jgi:hypothetical protein
MNTVTESIFDGTSIVPFSDVQHIAKRGKGDIAVVMKTTRYNVALDDWDNAVHFSAAKGEAERFVAAWCHYRSELDADTLADLSPGTA